MTCRSRSPTLPKRSTTHWEDLADNYAGKATTLIVDADGKGDYSTIQEAVDAMPASNAGEVLVRAGEYLLAKAVAVEDREDLVIRGVGKMTRLRIAGKVQGLVTADAEEGQRSVEVEDGSSMGTGGFLVDGLRLVRNEKSGSAGDSASQAAYGKRSLVEVDKTITDTGYAGYVAGSILAHRKNPTVTVQARVPGRGQPGYRLPQTVAVTSLRDGLPGKTFQIQRARHRYTPGGGYICDLDLVAARAPDGAYEPEVAPSATGLGSMLSELRIGQLREGLNSLRSEWV